MKYKLLIVVSILMFVSGCSAGTEKKQSNKMSSDVLLTSVWEDVVNEAKGQQVNMYMWGGSESINRYIDEWIVPNLKENADVTLKRIPMTDTKDIINQLLDEKQVGKESGSMDIVWINGENFKTAKENNLLFGSFINQLPNYNQFVDKDSPDSNRDFGEDISGLEAPWGKAQFVFVYDEEQVKTPPTSMEELKSWVKENPGKFTYPAPPDFTGSAFVRHALYETTGGYDQYFKGIEEQENMEKTIAPLWDFLNEIEPYLWREGKTYPESLGKLDQLYSSGEVWMTMGYDPARASTQVQNGLFAESTRTFVLMDGTLSNSHYLSIPFNSSHQAGAMVAINFMLSPDAQITKLEPKYWGDLMSIDLNKLNKEDQLRVSNVDLGAATLPTDVLASHRLPEIPAVYVDVIEKGWMEHVAKD